MVNNQSDLPFGLPRVNQQWFEDYLAANPQVWKAFESQTFVMIQSGQRLGAKAVAERVRWEMCVERGQDGYKVNNNATAFLARKFMQTYPQHAGLFRTRSSAADSATQICRSLQTLGTRDCLPGQFP